jgi:thiol-disulfide isomerase/thioredoxin
MKFNNCLVYCFLVMTSIWVASCSSEKPAESFTLSGNIIGIPEGQAILKTLDLATNETLTIDTATIAKGQFVFEGTVDQPYPHSLVINDSLQVNFFLENAEIQMDINTIEGRMDVAGSVSDSLFQPYWAQLELMWARSDSLQLQGLLAQSDEERRLIDSLLLEQSDAEMLFSLEFINQFPDSHVAPFAAFYFVQTYDVPSEGLREILDEFAPELKSSVYTMALEEIYELKEKLSPGKPAPGFTLPDSLGTIHKLEDYRDKLVLLDFWASWCRPCREQNRYMKALFQENRGKDFIILSISVDENREEWLDAVRLDAMGWPQLCSGQAWDTKAALEYGVRAIPQNFLIGYDGNIIGQNITISELKAILEQAQ